MSPNKRVFFFEKTMFNLFIFNICNVNSLSVYIYVYIQIDTFKASILDPSNNPKNIIINHDN